MNTIAKIPRCVVTGQREGRSRIIKDGQITNVSEHIPGLIISDIWVTDTMPVDLSQEVKAENTLFPHTPKNGTYFRYVFIPPDSKVKQYYSHLEKEVKPGMPHPLMHKTGMLEYVIILSGELYLILDDNEALLKPGDNVVQLGSNHAWSNRSDKPCVQIAILIDAKTNDPKES